MKNKLTKFIILLVLGVMFTLSTFTINKKPDDILYQVATISSLLDGIYDSDTNLSKFIGQDSIGIGTFNQLDGEMIIQDGKIYKATSNKKLYLMPKNTKTPFAGLVNFSCDKKFDLLNIKNFEVFKKALDEKLSAKNKFYAFKIKGVFDFIKVRSVPKQKKPYPLLVDVAKKQAVFSKKNVAGMIIGFKLPKFVEGINVPGYHLHFINDEKNFGGHVLNFEAKKLSVSVDEKNKLFLILPDNADFQKNEINLEGKSHQLMQVEK